MVLPHLHAQMHHVLPLVGLFQFGVVFWAAWRHLMIYDGFFFSLGAMGGFAEGSNFFSCSSATTRTSPLPPTDGAAAPPESACHVKVGERRAEGFRDHDQIAPLPSLLRRFPVRGWWQLVCTCVLQFIYLQHVTDGRGGSGGGICAAHWFHCETSALNNLGKKMWQGQRFRGGEAAESIF